MNRLTLLFICCLVSTIYGQKPLSLHAGKKQLALSSLDIKVSIVGNIATTTYDMLFYNPSSRVLEGSLKFPLAENQEISRLALEMNGKLREAVVVEKELGRIAFEGVVRRGVDPALLEKGKGNTYNVRVYPIPARGYKRVVIAYEQELLFKEKAHYYHLPLNFKDRLDSFNVFIETIHQNQQPLIVKGEETMSFSPWKNSFKTSLEKKNYIPNKSILVKIPLAFKTEKLITTPDYFYFYKTLKPSIRNRKKPNKITLYWDTSLSMKDKNITKEMELLNAYFLHLKNVEIRFISFSNTVLNNKKYSVKNGEWQELKKELQNTVYDGGTSFSAIEQIKDKSDAVLLFTDGLTTLSTASFYKKSPVFIINSKIEAAHKSLFQVAEKTNGGYVNLNTSSIKEALSILNTTPLEYLGFSARTKNMDVCPTVSSKGLLDFSVAGKNYVDGDKVTFFFGYGDDITQEASVVLNSKTVNNNDLIKRIWAKNKLNELLEKKKENKEQIIDLATKYGLVTEYTSLIVLEDIQDYINYNITPPEELLEEYNRLKNKKQRFVNRSNNLPPPPAPERIELIEDEMEIEEAIVEASQVYKEIEDRSHSTYRSSPSVSNKKKPPFVKYKGNLKIANRIPKTTYLNALTFFKKKEEAYAFYLTQRESYKEVPHYYIDVSDYFLRKFKSKELSDRILSNVAELDADSYELLRAFAYKLEERKNKELAVFIYTTILELRPEDAQSYRDLALAYQNIGLCQEAFDLFLDIVTEKIYKENKHRRVFQGLQDIAKQEIKLLIKKYKEDLIYEKIPEEYLDETAAIDLRVVVDWNHNDTDIDLHIIDPNLEECYYIHPKTQQGGRMSIDMTQGFGPEEFRLINAKKGFYYIKIKYFGDNKQKIETPTFMKVTIFKNQGKRNEERIVRVIRLTKQDNEEVIAKILF